MKIPLYMEIELLCHEGTDLLRHRVHLQTCGNPASSMGGVIESNHYINPRVVSRSANPLELTGEGARQLLLGIWQSFLSDLIDDCAVQAGLEFPDGTQWLACQLSDEELKLALSRYKVFRNDGGPAHLVRRQRVG